MTDLIERPPPWWAVAPRQPWAWQAGELEAVDVADPAVATDWSYTPQGGRWEQLESIRARFVSDGNAGNRIAVLTVADQRTRVLYEQPVLAAQITGLTVDYSWAYELGTTYPTLGGKVALPMPRIVLRPGWTVSVVTTTKQAGDQWSLVTLVVRRYIDGAQPTAVY